MRGIAAVTALAFLTACRGAGTAGTSIPSTAVDDGAVRAASPGAYVKHIVILIQENRSFDNVFSGFPGADAPTSGTMRDGTKVSLESIPFEVHDMDHYFTTGVMDYDGGKMDGFNRNPTSAGHTIGRFAYSHLESSEIAPYWTIAQRYTLADRMFPTMFGPSFTGHLTLIGGTANLTPAESEADVPSADPWGCDAPAGTTTNTVNEARVVSGDGPFPCFTQFRTLADTLDAAHVTWRYYAPVVGGTDDGQIWSTFDGIRKVRYGPDWRANVVSPPTKIITDAKNGRLASVSWAVPDFLWSDHPYAGTPYGPSWISAVINAIGSGPDWRSTAIVVVWDDWGGFYDDAPPPQLDFRGLGIRVPCLIVSPYVRPHVSHTQYEFGSILKFVEQTFGLPQLGPASAGYTDGRSASLVDSFDFTMAPRTFKPIPAPYPASFFLSHAASRHAPDEY